MGDSAGDSSQNLREEAARVVELAKELQDSASEFVSKTCNEEQSLRQRALVLESNLKKLRSSIDDAVARGAIDRSETEKLHEELYKAKYVLTDGDVASLLPSKTHGSVLCTEMQEMKRYYAVKKAFVSNGTFLKKFLGPINVRAMRKDVQLNVKKEYNSYKDRTAFLFLLFPSTLLLLRAWLWNGCFPVLPVQLYQAWLLFLYTSLALRENILRVNGSDIRPWWIYHHYCAMLMALTSLTWEIKGEPDCAHKQKGVQLFLAWAMMQGVAMLLQNRYQRQRLYTRIALGKGFEAYIGLLLLKTAVAGVVSEWQVIVCGMLLVVMAAGNFINTVRTLMVKLRFKAKMKRSKSKQELDQGLAPGNSIMGKQS
ncbi:transmembrane protein 120 [Cinnamomum micranthum f. kanehirae]|uniref:Transmembrane protein 120 n=1 Tax=Cinnamomum micranthum f. kanehirae TaxID=337451 RepID=A0A3S3N4Z5_9MAGN|nr:transmembrane protein 120 [Cinnamomum micranthum f. kanehirae]